MEKIKILAIVTDKGAVAQIRIISSLKYLKESGYIEYEILDLSETRVANINYIPDIVIVQRVSDLIYYNYINYLKLKGATIVFEIDDNLLELPLSNPNHSHYSNPIVQRSLLEYIWLADHLIVSTENLKQFFLQYNKSIYVVPNQIDEEIFKNKIINKTNPAKIRIGFAGTITHEEDFLQVEQALKEIQIKYEDKIQIVFINMLPKSFARDKTIEFLQGNPKLDKFAEILLNAKIDIGLAPLAYNKFNMGKSDIKFLEYGISGIAGIYSNFGPYKRSVVNDQTGLLVNFESTSSWILKLSFLIENPSEIDRIKRNAMTYVSEKRTIKSNYKNWLNVFNQIRKKKSSSENISQMEKKSIIEIEKEKPRTNKHTPVNVSIIIPVYNKVELTKQCIESIYTKTEYLNFEIIIVDNGSNDRTQDYLKELTKSQTNVKVIWNKQNHGFAKANNQAVEIAIGKYLLLLNNDTIVHSQWLETLVKTIEGNDEIGIVGSKLLYPDGTIQHAGVAIVKDELNNIEINPWHIGHKSKDEEQFNKVEEVKAVTAACMLIKRNVFLECNGFNEQFWNGFEDVDLCFKVTNKNYKIIYQPQSVITHLESQSGKERYSKENDNLKLLLSKWSGKIIPDLILKKDGSFIRYNSVSIIIVTYNSEKTILSCINSLRSTIRKNDEVVIVDNNSKDKTVKVINKAIKDLQQFRIIKSDNNIGFSAGCNIGIKNSNKPFIVLLNPDTIVTENWLDKMTSVCHDKKVAAVGPISNFAAGLQNASGYLEQNELSILDAKIISKEVEKRFYKKTVEAPMLIGFCMMIKRSILNELGTLDENLFLGNDDLDLSWRFRLNGYKLLVVLDTFIYHKGQQSFNTEKKSVTNKLVQESTDKLYEKLVAHYGENNIPTPKELWGINWFAPTNARFNSSSKLLDKKTCDVSIVIPTFNQWEYTKQAIDSIEKFTNLSYEIIIVDNASTDNTVKQLEKYNNVKVITNNINTGFPKAINQGILNSNGDYIFILNNDIVVTKNWLSRLIAVADSDNKIGIVGPISNSVSGVQIDNTAKYKTIKQMHKHAERISNLNKGKITEFPRVAFLCTLIKKEVFDKIGGLDERFTPGNFEDDDFCLRAQLAGYKTVIASDVFIHHYGSVSFKKNGENKYAERLEINKQKFIDKWGATPEEIWLQGKKHLNKEIKFPINNDLFIESFERALININDEEYDLAITNLKSALDNYERSERKGYENISLSDVLNMAGTISLSKNQLEEAREYFEKELKTNPTSSSACFGLGEVFYKADLLNDSKTMYEWAVLNDNKNTNAKIRLEEINTKLNLPKDHNSVLTNSQAEKVENV